MPKAALIVHGGAGPIPASELDNWQKATANLPDEWIKDVGAKGQDGKMLLQSAKDMIKKYESAK